MSKDSSSYFFFLTGSDTTCEINLWKERGTAISVEFIKPVMRGQGMSLQKNLDGDVLGPSSGNYWCHTMVTRVEKGGGKRHHDDM